MKKRVITIIAVLVIVAGILMGWKFYSELANNSKGSDDSTNSNYCDQVFADIIKKIGGDYNKCAGELSFSSNCTSPEGAKTPFSKVNIAIILDSSGSMEGVVSGQKKIDIAKKSVVDFVSSLPKEINVSLIVYGHKGSNADTDKSISCSGVETIYPLSPLNLADFASKVNSFSPKGWTPLASAIKQAQAMLQAGGASNKNIIYIVSDGLETCGGDPSKVANEVNKSDSKVEVNIIGFVVNNEEQTKLKEVATSGGGKFYFADSSASLNQIFDNSKADLNNYLLCNNSAMGRLSIESGSLAGRIAICFGSNIGKESINFGAEKRNLNKEDMLLCSSVLDEKFDQRLQFLQKTQEEIENKNTDLFLKSLQVIKDNQI
jgi:hypothetical protein